MAMTDICSGVDGFKCAQKLIHSTTRNVSERQAFHFTLSCVNSTLKPRLADNGRLSARECIGDALAMML